MTAYLNPTYITLQATIAQQRQHVKLSCICTVPPGYCRPAAPKQQPNPKPSDPTLTLTLQATITQQRQNDSLTIASASALEAQKLQLQGLLSEATNDRSVLSEQVGNLTREAAAAASELQHYQVS